MVLSVTTACSTPTSKSSDTDQSRLAEACNSLVPRTLSAYTTGLSRERSGFRDIPDLNSGVSLYDTYWNLKIYETLGIASNIENSSVLEKRLIQAKDELKGEGGSEGSPLHVVEMIDVIQRSAGLSTVDIKPELTKLKTGKGYTWTTSDEADPGSNFIGIRSNSRIDPSSADKSTVKENVIADALNLSPKASIQEIISEGVPTLAALGYLLSPADFKKAVPNAQIIFDTWASTIMTLEMDPIALSALSMMTEMSDLGLVRPFEFDASQLSEFPRSGPLFAGYDAVPDSQITYYAVHLGFRDPDIIDNLESQLSDVGWLRKSREQDLSSSYYASTILDWCGAEIPSSEGAVSDYANGDGDDTYRNFYLACSLNSLQEKSFADSMKKPLEDKFDQLPAGKNEASTSGAYRSAIKNVCGIGREVEVKSFAASSEPGFPDLISAGTIHGSIKDSPELVTYAERLKTLSGHTFSLEGPEGPGNILLSAIATSALDSSDEDRIATAERFICDGIFSESEISTANCGGTGFLEQFAGLSLLRSSPASDLVSLLPEAPVN